MTSSTSARRTAAVGFRQLAFPIGAMLSALATAMLIPAIIDLADANSNWTAFAASSAATFLVAGLMISAGLERKPHNFTIRDGFLLTTSSWFTMSAFAALPLIIMHMSAADAFFEAVSGLTTTGSTVLTGLDHLPRGILLWRAVLQGIGGLGIIAMAILVLPALRVGGMQLFKMESSDRSDKAMARSKAMVSSIAGIYAVLILACTAAFGLAGMTPFDAICHALTTISTGGFSNHDESFAYFHSVQLDWIATLFMIMGSLPFLLYIRVLQGNADRLFTDTQVKGFLLFLVFIWIAMTADLILERHVDTLHAIHVAAFNTTSIVSTTGFYTEDYVLWGPFAMAIILILTFVGGCSGSTAGGLKIYRFQVMNSLARRHLLGLMSPSRVIPLKYNGKELPHDVPFSVTTFFVLYMTSVGLFTLILAALGLDLITSFSSAAQAVGNVGPGLGDTVGPTGNFAALPTLAKWTLAVAMLLGRLELFTVLVLLRREFWQS